MDEIVIERSLRDSVLVMLILSLFFGLTILVDPREMPDVVLAISIAFKWLSGAGIVFFLISLVMGLPHVVIDRAGIRYRHLFRKGAWSWNDCGRFFLSTQHIPSGRWTIRHRYACAFNSLHQRAIDAEGAGLVPDYLHADILIPLEGTRAGRSEKTAQDFVDQLNDHRQRHARGIEEIPILEQNSRAILESLQAKGRINRRLYALIMMALLIAITVLLVIY